MKRKLLFCFFIISISAGAQTSVYHPFPDSGAVWVMKMVDYCVDVLCYTPPALSCPAYYQYRVSGDTIISGNVCKKVFQEGYTPDCYCDFANTQQCSTSTFYSYFFGGLRNDSVNKKVFLDEHLLLDFNLNIGDTLTNSYCSRTITGIDSVLVGNSYRKRYLTSMWGEIIEGIGDVASTGFSGPFNACACVCSHMWNFCSFIQNGNVIYGDTSCSLITSVKNISKETNTISLFPNPASNELRIQNAGFKIECIEIYDVVGEKRLTLNPSPGGERLRADVSSLASGIYFVRVKTEKGISTQKFIKQ